MSSLRVDLLHAMYRRFTFNELGGLPIFPNAFKLQAVKNSDLTMSYPSSFNTDDSDWAMQLAERDFGKCVEGGLRRLLFNSRLSPVLLPYSNLENIDGAYRRLIITAKPLPPPRNFRILLTAECK